MLSRQKSTQNRERQSGVQKRKRITILSFVGLLFAAPLVVSFIAGPVSGTAARISSNVSDLSRADSGVFLLSTAGPVQLPEANAPRTSVPPGTVTLEHASIRGIAVVQKIHFSPNEYRLFGLQNGRVVDWRDKKEEGKAVLLDTGELPEGEYLLIVPSAGFFGGETFHYFRLE